MMFGKSRRILFVSASLFAAVPVILTLIAMYPISNNQALRFRQKDIRQSEWLLGRYAPGFAPNDMQKPVPDVIHLIFKRQPVDRMRGVPWSFRGSVGRACQNWRFDSVLGRQEIVLQSDPNELENILLATKSIDSFMLMPGATFSFNDKVGVRSKTKGYKPGLMFQQGQVVLGTGGGICTVSTALYDASLKAGLRILDRSPHSGIPRYAGPGFDAAVVYRSLDLKIKNNMPTPVLIRAYVRDNILAVTLLGRRVPGIEITVTTEGYKEIPYKIFEKPNPEIPEGEVKVKQTAKMGCEIDTARIIKKNNRVIHREIVDHSYYPPRHKIVLVPMPKENPQVDDAEQAATGESGNAVSKSTTTRVDSFPTTEVFPLP